MVRILLLVVLILVIAYVVVAMCVARRISRRRAAKRRELAAIAARSDQQNAWFLAGDPRGIYGAPIRDRSWITFGNGLSRSDLSSPPPLTGN